MPLRAIRADRDADTAAPSARTPNIIKASETLRAVVQTRWLCPSMVSCTGRAKRTTTRSPLSSDSSSAGTTRSREPTRMSWCSSTSPTVRPKLRTSTTWPSTERLTVLSNATKAVVPPTRAVTTAACSRRTIRGWDTEGT
jgi:hypothetical protein